MLSSGLTCVYCKVTGTFIRVSENCLPFKHDSHRPHSFATASTRVNRPERHSKKTTRGSVRSSCATLSWPLNRTPVPGAKSRAATWLRCKRPWSRSASAPTPQPAHSGCSTRSCTTPLRSSGMRKCVKCQKRPNMKQKSPNLQIKETY